jgi:hypothetical protein
MILTSQVKLGTSEPIGSVEFRRFLYYRIPVQISSDEFRSVPIGFVDFQRIPGRNFAELFRRNLDRNPVVKKSSEFNGADRKSTESIGSVAGKQRKQPVPAVGTVDLGYYKLMVNWMTQCQSSCGMLFIYFLYSLFIQIGNQ